MDTTATRYEHPSGVRGHVFVEMDDSIRGAENFRLPAAANHDLLLCAVHVDGSNSVEHPIVFGPERCISKFAAILYVLAHSGC